VKIDIEPFTYYRENNRDTWSGPIVCSWIHISFFGRPLTKVAIDVTADEEEVLEYFIDRVFQGALEATEEKFLNE